MIYNDDLFIKLQKGWDEPKDACVEWANLTEKDLGEYINVIIEYGIQPLLNDLVGTNTLTNIPKGKVVLLSKDDFSLIMGLYEYRVENQDSKAEELIKCLSAADSILDAAKSFREKNSCYYSGLDGCLSVCTGIQGFAIAGFQLINKDAAIKELGLHLICHELMHTIANSSAVNKLRSVEDPMGDEAINEFFARLATQYLIASGVDAKLCGITTTEEMKSSTEANHDDWGAYGKRIKTSCDICNVVNSTDKLTALKALARFYFLGEKRPLKID